MGEETLQESRLKKMYGKAGALGRFAKKGSAGMRRILSKKLVVLGELIAFKKLLNPNQTGGGIAWPAIWTGAVRSL